MLSDSHTKLLTAYVDGEIQARDRQTVERLLAASPEARALLEKLQGDSKELQNVPPVPAPSTLANIVLETVHDHAPLRQPQSPAASRVAPRSPTVRPASGIPRWLGIAAAACVLIASGIGTFFLAGALLNGKNRDTDSGLANRHNDKGNVVAKVEDEDVGIKLAVAELNDPPVMQRLANELKKQTGFWFDMPAISNKGAFQRLKTSFKQSGIKVLVDGSAGKNLSYQQQSKFNYVLYVENLLPAEAAEILQHFSQAEQEAVLPANRTLDYFVMRTMHANDRGKLADFMRVGPKTLDPPEMGPDLLVPMYGAKVAGGDVPAKAKKQPERLALVFALVSGRAPADSPELREFRSARQELRQGTVQLVLWVHEQDN